MREAQQVLKEAQWADDSEATHCKQCEKQFSVSRRKVSRTYHMKTHAFLHCTHIHMCFAFNYLST